jgi:hypothetical protein
MTDESSFPAVPAPEERPNAAFTCPRTWGSPMTPDSRLAATRERWRKASSQRRSKTGRSRSPARARSASPRLAAAAAGQDDAA